MVRLERLEVAPLRVPFAPEAKAPAKATEPAPQPQLASRVDPPPSTHGTKVPVPSPASPQSQTAEARREAPAAAPLRASEPAPKANAPEPPPDVRLVNRSLGPESPEAGVKLFEPEGSAEGCASGECLPDGGEKPSNFKALAPTSAPAFELTPDEPEPEVASSKGVETEHERWARAVEAVRQASPRHGKSLSYARFLGFSAEGVRVAFAPDAAFHRAQVTGMSRDLVQTELTRALGRATKLIEDTTPQAFAAAPKSIAEVEATDRASRERAIDAKVREHPGIRAVLKHLGGTIEHVQYLEPAPAVKPALTTPDEATTTEE